MPEQGKNRVIPFYRMKLRDAVKSRALLHVTCWSYKRTGTLDVPQLIHKFGPLLSLRDLEKRTFRCTYCGGSANSIKVEWLE
jgi:hypothetical protein